MGFGIRLAPGLRLSLSSRGLRAGIGPRAARLHVGAGRPSISSGVGPFTVWSPIGPKRRRRATRRTPKRQSNRSTQSNRASAIALQRQAAAAERAQQVAALAEIERRLLTLHLEVFPPAHPRQFPLPPAVNRNQVRRELRKQALAGIPWHRFADRRAARRQADQWVPDAVAAEQARRQAEWQRAEWQENTWFQQLHDNEPLTVIQALEAAFEDNQSPAAPINCLGSTATVLILFPGPELVPERKPGVTAGGKPTLVRRTKTESQALYLAAMGSTVLATVKEGFATAPSLTEFRVVVIRRNPVPTSGEDLFEAVYAGCFQRVRLDTLDWPHVDCAGELLVAPGALLHRVGRAGEVRAIDLRGEPELANVLAGLARSATELVRALHVGR